MRKEDIYKVFTNMFPEYEDRVVSYRKIGSKMIGLEMEGGLKLSFLYMGHNNWNLGTKPWRKKPTPLRKMNGIPAKLGEVNKLVSN